VAFSDVIDLVKTHATDAGAALAVPITNVAVGWPVPSGSCVRIYWTGEAEPVRMGTQRVLNAELVSDRIVVVAWFRIPDFSETAARNLILDMRLFKHELRTRLLADSQLNGGITDLETDYMDGDFVQVGGAAGPIYGTVTTEIVADYTEYPIVA
jgi:hypothetical protein